jgi:hypothetical protein
MCYQVVERYSVCRCLYYKHAIDPCAAHGQRGHQVQEKTVLVGYACGVHSSHRSVAACHYDGHYDSQTTAVFSDSGYESDLYSPAQLR